MRKYIYRLTPVFSFWGLVVLMLFAFIQFAGNRTLYKQYGTQFSIRFMLYGGTLVLPPLLIIEWLLQARIAPELYAIIILGVLYLSGVAITVLMGRYLRKIGL